MWATETKEKLLRKIFGFVEICGLSAYLYEELITLRPGLYTLKGDWKWNSIQGKLSLDILFA